MRPNDGSLQRPRRCAPRAARTVTAFPVLADRARAWRQNQNGRETTSGQKIISPRCFARARRSNIGARRCLSPKTKALAPRGFARCKASALCSKTGGLFFATTSFSASKNRRTCRPELIGPATSRIASRPAVGVLPCHPKNARHSAPLIRLDAGKNRQRVQTPRQSDVSFAAPLSCRNASGTITQHTLSVWSFLPP